MNILQALWQRAQQESQSLEQGRLGVGPDPTNGPGVNVPGGRLNLPALAAIHALGLIQEGAGNAAEATMGTLGGAIAGGQQAGYYALHPNETPSATDAHYIAAWDNLIHGHPIGANQELGRANGLVNAIGTAAVNPLNFTGPASEADGIIGALGRIGHLANEAPVLPLKALLAAKRAEQGARGAAAGEAVLRALLGGPAPATDAAAVVRKAIGDVPVESPTPLGPDLPGVQGPPQPGRRLVPETQLPETPYTPGNVPARQGPLGPALPPEQGPILPPEYGPAFPERGNVPRRLLDLIGGKRQLGPPVPPVASTPATPPALPATFSREPTFAYGNMVQLRDIAARLGATPRAAQPAGELAAALRGLAERTPTPLLPREAVTPAEEAAARALPEVPDAGRLPWLPGEVPATGTPVPPEIQALSDGSAPFAPARSREDLLGFMTGKQTNTLMELAYDHPKARFNARNAHPEPIDLREAAIARITRDPSRVARLQQLDPDLAAKVAALPDADAAALANVDIPGAGAIPAEVPASPLAAPATPTPAPPDLAQRAAAAKADLFGDAADVTPKPNTPTGALPGMPGLQAGGATYTPIADAPLTAKAQEAAPFALQMQYGKLAPAEVGRIKQVDAGQTSLLDAVAPAPTAPDPLDARLALRGEFKQALTDAVGRGNHDEIGSILDLAPEYGYTPTEAGDLHQELLGGAGDLTDHQLQIIEQSPYFATFKYFNPQTGELKRVNPQTGARLIVHEGGKISKGRAEVWEIPGSGYDEVAASALAPFGGYNPRLAVDTGDFWRNARDAFKQYQALKAGKSISPGSFVGDFAAGGGGGGMGLLPYPGGLTGPVGRAILPAAGAGIGGGVGALTGDNPEDAKANALKGAALGAAVGGAAEVAPEVAHLLPHLAAATDGTWLSGTMLARAWRAGERAQEAAVGAAGAKGAGGFVKAMPGAWRAQAVNTIKQLPQDALNQAVTLWGVARDEFGIGGGDIRYWQDHLSAERDARVSSLQNPVTDRLRQLGLQRLLDPGEFGTVYGTDFLSSERAGQPTLNAKQSSAMGAIFSGYNGLPSVNPLTIGAGAVKGRFQPFINGFVQFANGVQHDAFRYAMADATLRRDIPPLADALIADLNARGVNTAPLAARGGFFSGADVAQVAGPALGRQWDQLLEETVRNGGDRIAFLAGDFRNKLAPGYPGTVTPTARVVGRVEQTLGKAIPFIRWPIHYGPVLAEIAIAHPRVATVAAGLLAQQQAQAQQLIRAGAIRADEAGSLPLTTETPVLGAYARARLGGQAGTVRVNPLAAVVPYTQLLGGVQLPTNVNATGYERANAVLSAAGMSPNPAIQAVAYATGNDTQAPGALSRTSGLEGLAGLLPGGLGSLSVPSLGAGLDAARQVVTGQQTSEYDPAMRRYAELVLDRTGKPLSHPDNLAYLRADTPAARALFDQAKREVLVANAVGNATSLTSPVSATAHGADAQAIAEQRRMLYTPAQMVQSSPGVAALMQQANARYAAAHPAIGVNPATGTPVAGSAAYAGASNSAREQLLLGDIADRSPLDQYLSAQTRQALLARYQYAIRNTALR